MHRIDADSHVANMFDEGDPGVPRAPTQVDADWLNMVQEELVALPTDASITLVKGTNTQLRDALRALFVRVTGAVAQTITGIKTFTSRMVITQGTSTASLIVTNTSTGGVLSLENTSTGPGLTITNNSATNTALDVENTSSGPVGRIVGSNSTRTLEVSNGSSGSAIEGTAATGYGVSGVTTSGIGVSGTSSGAVTAVQGASTGSGSSVKGDSSFGSGYGGHFIGNATRPPLHLVPQAAPSTPANGSIYYDSTAHKLKVYANGAWETITSA